MNFKNWTVSKVLAVIFILVCIYLAGHIIYWFVNGTYTEDLLGGITEEEVVGVEVPAYGEPQLPKEKQIPFIETDFSKLKERNSDTVAWLRVDAADISIPIVQSTDNEYYLNHDIDKKVSNMGWVFADTRNNMEFLGENTVLYGHNVYNKQMFGNLKKLLNVDPDKKEQAKIIQFNTPTKQMVFEITSVYVTDYKDWKYVSVDFAGEEGKNNFITRMRDKNTVDVFDRNDLSVHDQFLTFSTCYGPAGTSERLVVHAKLTGIKD
jgi:SrtB family sortase